MYLHTALVSFFVLSLNLYAQSPDIGDVRVRGDFREEDRKYILRGQGDFTGRRDAGFFMSVPRKGNLRAQVRVLSVEGASPWAKAGLMLRRDHSPEAAYTALLATPDNRVLLQTRAETGGEMVWIAKAMPLPLWLRLDRVDGTIHAFVSGDGVLWEGLGEPSALGGGESLQTGLAVSSGGKATPAVARMEKLSGLDSGVPSELVTDRNAIEIDTDNRDAVRTRGRWVASQAPEGFAGQQYLVGGEGPGGYVIFQPSLPQTGKYAIFAHVLSGPEGAENVAVEVKHAEGLESLRIDQKSLAREWRWLPLGPYSFFRGDHGSVTVGADGARGTVVVDALRFVPAP